MQELDPRFMSDDGSLSDDSNLSYWSKLICDAAVKYNRPLPHHSEYVRWFERAGFVDVKRIYLKSPTNPWPKDPKLKEVGKFQLIAHIEGLESVSIGLLTRVEEWKLEEVKVLMAKMRPELKDRSIHSYQMKYVINICSCVAQSDFEKRCNRWPKARDSTNARFLSGAEASESIKPFFTSSRL